MKKIILVLLTVLARTTAMADTMDMSNEVEQVVRLEAQSKGFQKIDIFEVKKSGDMSCRSSSDCLDIKILGIDRLGNQRLLVLRTKRTERNIELTTVIEVN